MTNLYFIIFLVLFSCSKELLTQPDIPSDITQAGLEDIVLWDPPDSAVFIDPENSTSENRNGTIENPYSSFSEIEWKDNTIYAIKRGTTMETEMIMLFADSVTLASYGEGSRPVIKSTSESHAVSTKWENGQNVTIRDLEIFAPNAVSCLIFRSNSINSKAINLKLHGSQWGLRALNNLNGLYIYNTEIFDIKDDGIFIQESINIEISHCKVYKVNQNWSPPSTPSTEAAGDGIQLERCNLWHVHHNKIDRSDTANKFCFISNNPEQDSGVFEYNELKGPIGPGFSIYIGDGENMIIRYNFISGPSNSPFYSHASNLKIYYNVFRDINGPLYASGSAEVYNNLFYNSAMAIEGGNITARNNIFDFPADRPRFKVKNLIESNNLFVYGLPTRNSFKGNPQYVDPEMNNFSLSPNSDCIDKGVDVGINFDMKNNPVPEGEGPDIGPFEYQP